MSVGNDLELEVAALARLVSRLVLYASIYVLLRLAISRSLTIAEVRQNGCQLGCQGLGLLPDGRT